MKRLNDVAFAALMIMVSSVAVADDIAPVRPLSLKQAQDTARSNHPRIQVAQLHWQASQEAIVQAKAAYLPHITQETVGAISNSSKNAPARLAAGWGLVPPPVASRAATGVVLKQLVTDFGRTSSLVDSSELKARADEETLQATDAQVLLAVTSAYYQVLQAQEVLSVADETYSLRTLNRKQVKALMDSGLRSSLDLSFAEVNLSEAELLRIKARNDLNSARAILSTAMGNRETEAFEAEEQPMPPSIDRLDTAITEALYRRPDLRTARLQLQAAEKFVEAEEAASRPKIEFVGDINYMPWINLEPGTYPKFNLIGGLIIDVPVFEGFELQARAQKARKEAVAASYSLTDAENAVLRDVRVSWMNSKTAFERLEPARQQLAEAEKAYKLAQSRYEIGLGSIVELTQSQLNLTRAQIGEIEVRIEYQQQRAELEYQAGRLR